MRTAENNEFLTLENASSALDTYDQSSFQLVQESLLSQAPTKMVTFIYSETLKKNQEVMFSALENVTMVYVNRDDITNFFTKVYKAQILENTPLTTPLKNVNEIEELRPQYLDSLVDEIALNINGIINGTINSKDKIKPYIGDAYTTLLKKRTVKTTIPYDQDYKLLIRSSNKVVPCQVTEVFLTQTVLPFLKTYPETAKKLVVEVNKLNNALTRGFTNLSEYMKTYNDISQTRLSKDVWDLLSYYLFNVGRMFLDLANYATYMMVRRLNNYSFNVNSYLKLYQTILSYYPEGENILHESVLDGTLGDVDELVIVFDMLTGDNGIFKTICKRILDSHMGDIEMRTKQIGSDREHSQLSIDIDEQDYDKTPYQRIDDVLDTISNSLAVIDKNSRDEFITIEDLKEKSGLDTNLDARFSGTLAGISDISVYTDEIYNIENGSSDVTKEDVLYTIMNELEHFEENIDHIVTKIHGIFLIAKEMDEKFQANVNGEYDSPIIDEIRTFVRDFEVTYRDLVLLIVKKLFKRLDALDECANSITGSRNSPENISVDDETDFVQESVISIMEDNTELASYMTQQMNRVYKEKAFEERYGVSYKVFLEADGDPQISQSGGGDQAGNTQQPQAAQNVAKTQNAQNNQNQGTDQKQNEKTDGKTSENPEDKKKDRKTMIDRMVEFFNNIIQKFTSACDRQFNINTNWLSKNKDGLLARKIRNMRINNVYIYDEGVVKRLPNDIQALITNINSLTDDKINTTENEKLDSLLFGFIQIRSDIPIRDKMVQWYTTGANEMKTTEISNSQIEKRIPIMINYCEMFYQNLYRDVSNKIENLMNAWKNKATALTESETSKIYYINKQIKYYAGAVLNAIRDRNYAYLKILKAVAPKGKNNTAPENSGENQEQNNNQNQEQEKE